MLLRLFAKYYEFTIRNRIIHNHVFKNIKINPMLGHVPRRHEDAKNIKDFTE